MSGTFQLAGTIVGSFFGPIGGAVGGAIGGLVDQEVFGKAINGPRINEFRATGSAVGKPITRGYGTNRLGGELIWMGRVRERKNTKTTGGIAGFGGQKTNTFEHYATFAVGLQEGPDVCLRNIRINGRIWWEDPGYASGNADYLDQQTRLLEFGPSALTADELSQYNATAQKVAASQGRSEFFTFYSGSSNQSVDPTIATYLGDHAPAYRDLAYVVFKELDVTEYGGALPLIEFETVRGDTQSGQSVNIWVAKELNPWAEGSNDPRHPNNDHRYKYSATWRDTLDEAAEDAETSLGYSINSDILIGWNKVFSEDSLNTVSPYWPVDPEERETLFLHFNRYAHLVAPDRYFATFDDSSGDVCGSFFIDGIEQGDDYFWWQFKLSDGSTPTAGGGAHAGVFALSIRYPDDVFDPERLAGPGGGNNCTVYPPEGGYYPVFTSRDDTLIEVQRVTVCPDPPCAEGDPLPENPDYCVIDGNIYPEVTYAETTDGTFLQLAVYTTDSGDVTQYPVGPVINLDYAPHVARNTEEWWEPHYLAAVAAGTVPAGWTFDASGSGGVGTYPRTVTDVCQIVLTTPAYCTAEPVSVADVIEAEAVRCKPLVLADLDTSLVTDEIWGIKFESAPTGRDAIEQLRTFSFLDVVDGPQLKFVPRGLPAVATLTYDDLAAHEYGSQRPPAVEVTRIDDIQLPKEVRVSYIDKNADLQPGQQYDRRLVTDAVNVQTIELGIAMGADDGKRIATVSLYDQWAARKAIEFKLGPRWLMLEPTDCVEIPDLDGVTRIRIDRDDLAFPGLRSMQGVRDEISLYDRAASGATPQIPDSANEAPQVQGPTTAIVLDLPYMGIGDEDAGYWVAFYGTLDAWQSAEGYRSLDGGTTYDSVVSAGSAIAGVVVAPYDGSEITVQVYGGDLLSATAAAVAAGTNRFAIGAPGRWVIGSFETTSQDSDGNYILSDLTMGLFDTAWAMQDSSSPSDFLGAAGDSFVMLETASRVSEEDSIVGDTVVFRPVTAGTVFDNGIDQSFVARGNSRGFVTGFGTTTPPAHSQGATYIAGIGATGEWSGFDDYIVHDADDDWFFEFPEDGRQVRTTAGARYQYVAGSAGYWLLLPSEAETAETVIGLGEDVVELDGRVTTLEGTAELRGATFTSDTGSTADSDPGAGLMKWNHATQSSATVIYFDNQTRDAISLLTFYTGIPAAGYFYMQQKDDRTKWQLWKWSAVTDGTGYRKFTVTLQAYGGAIPDDKEVLVDFAPFGVQSVNSASGTVSLNGGYIGVKGADIASASTTDLGAATGDFVDVTGTNTITSLGTVASGIERVARFTGILTLTHNATSLILPTSADISTAAGDVVTFRSLGSGNWVCVGYMRASGQPLSGGGGGGGSTSTAAYASRPASGNAGNLFFPSDSFYVERDSGSAWAPWGPIFPMTPPDDSQFAWVNQGGASVTTTNGGIYLLAPANSGQNLRIRKKSAPSTPYTVTAAFLPGVLGVNFQAAGLLFRQSSDGKLATFSIDGNATVGAGISSTKWNSATSNNSAYRNPRSGHVGRGVVWLRIADNGTNRICSHSPDGINWLQFHSVGRTDFLTANEIGFFANDESNTDPAAMTLLSWKEA